MKDVDSSKLIVKDFKANSDLSRFDYSESLLTAAIVKNDFWIVKLLLDQLGANVDGGILQNPNYYTYPIYIAIWMDFYK